MKLPLCLSLFLALSAHADPIEITRMADALENVQPGTLVVLDIDNTILHPAQSLGSDPWWDGSIAREVAKGIPVSKAQSDLLPTYRAIMEKTRVVPVEADTPKLIAALQARGIRVVALTARDGSVADLTIRQLNDLGVHMSAMPPGLSLPMSGVPVPSQSGVLFAGNKNEKGLVLDAYLHATGQNPQNIVFVDDRLNNDLKLEASMNRLGWKPKVYRYGAMDGVVKAYDPQVGDAELKNFQSNGQILSDAAVTSAASPLCPSLFGSLR